MYIHICITKTPFFKLGLYAGIKRTFFRTRNRIPFIKKLIDQEVAKAGQSISDNVEQLYGNNKKGKCQFITVLPKAPMNPNEILVQVESYLKLGMQLFCNS